MTNELKLIMALCDALGFEVEEIFEQKIPSGQILIPHNYKLTKRPLFTMGKTRTSSSPKVAWVWKGLDEG